MLQFKVKDDLDMTDNKKVDSTQLSDDLNEELEELFERIESSSKLSIFDATEEELRSTFKPGKTENP